MLECIFEKAHASHTRDTPGSDDLDVGLEAVERKLETNLVVALARAAMRDEVTSLLFRDAHHATSDDWARKRSTEEVHVLARSQYSRT